MTSESRKLLREKRRDIDRDLDRHVPRKHAFTFFRIGVDLCAICQKTKKEHTS